MATLRWLALQRPMRVATLVLRYSGGGNSGRGPSPAHVTS
jgi:hypothetical protein